MSNLFLFYHLQCDEKLGEVQRTLAVLDSVKTAVAHVKLCLYPSTGVVAFFE